MFLKGQKNSFDVDADSTSMNEYENVDHYTTNFFFWWFHLRV